MGHLTCVGKEKEELEKIPKATKAGARPRAKCFICMSSVCPKGGALQEVISGSRGGDLDAWARQKSNCITE